MARRRRGKQLSFSVDLGLAEQLRQVADREDKSVDEFIGELLEAGLEKRNIERKIVKALKKLTPREREVCIWVARGHTNKQIAEELVITEETVRTHIRSIRHKLNLRSKTELRVYLIQLGMVFPE